MQLSLPHPRALGFDQLLPAHEGRRPIIRQRLAFWPCCVVFWRELVLGRRPLIRIVSGVVGVLNRGSPLASDGQVVFGHLP